MLQDTAYTTALKKGRWSFCCWAEIKHRSEGTLPWQRDIGVITQGESKMAPKMTAYQKDLIESLKDPQEAAAYLNAAMEDGERAVFLLALRNKGEIDEGNFEFLINIIGG
jgi:alpha-galactosidase/6-phospho-beta-glucosidase family protein